MRYSGWALALLVLLVCAARPAAAACDPVIGAIAGFYSQVDHGAETGTLVRLEFAGRNCTLVASLVDPVAGFNVFAGRSYFTLPETFGCITATVNRAIDPFRVMRTPVQSVATPGLLDPDATCQIQVNCNPPGKDLGYTCSGGRFGVLRFLRN